VSSQVTPHRGSPTTTALVESVLSAAPSGRDIRVDLSGARADDGGALSVGYSDASDLYATGIAVTLAATTFTAVAAGSSAPVSLALLGERHVVPALAAMAAGLLRGMPLADAARAVGAVTTVESGDLEIVSSAGGLTVVDDRYDLTPESTTEALKTLAELTAGGARSIAVLGELDLGDETDPVQSREAHDRIGRLVVRLNVSRLVVVGRSARHIHNAAGLEGSWDGESVLVDTLDEAYDLLNETEQSHVDSRTGVVLLVKCPGTTAITPLTGAPSRPEATA
jgi:UDP-N-acetylmuramoyl-tripeptide--D-alanyl-D-alanine ligase